MVTLEIRFPAGRYHATPWDRQVNEGEIDWPPSPWRLVRAFQAVWLARAQEDIPEATAVRLVEALASHLPLYSLPPASTGHTRHYMPSYGTTLDGKDSDKVFDTFAAMGRNEPLTVSWPDLHLDAELEQALGLLAERMTWLGRCESWVTVSHQPGVPSAPADCRPAGADPPLPGEERIRVLCPRSPGDYREWSATLPRPKGKGKKPLAPETLFEALMLDTADLKAAGWSQPPAGRWVDYLRPAHCLSGSAGRVQPRPRRRATRCPSVARYALASPVPPDLAEAVRVGDKLHQALVRLSDGHPTFTGRNADGSRRQGHQHAHFLAEPGPGGSKVRYATLWAPEGFDDRARRALEELTWLSHIGDHPLQAILLGFGQVEDFRLSPGGRPGAAGTSLVGSSRVWASLTPFVPTRHPRERGSRKFEDGLRVGGPEHDLRRLLKASGHPEPVQAHRLPECRLAGREFPWNRFRTRRLDGDGLLGGGPFVGWRLVFPEPVSGPLCLGYGSHFGLGLFVPEEGDAGPP